MNKEEITNILMSGNTGEYSHLIIFCDTFDYEDYPRYVKYDEDVEKIISDEGKYGGMTKVMEVYNYSLDLNEQLNEYRAYHIHPKGKENNNNKPVENERIKKALEFARNAHINQLRIDGSPYINHPIRVADNIFKYKKSKEIDNLIIASLLHDTIEDTNVTYYDIANNFGYLVAELVAELTNNNEIKNMIGKTRYLQIKLKNLSNWALDIKLCDRLDNIQDLVNADDIFQDKYTIETIDIINYLMDYRKLTKTQKNIINDINAEIKKQRDEKRKNDATGKFLKFLNRMNKKD